MLVVGQAIERVGQMLFEQPAPEAQARRIAGAGEALGIRIPFC